MRYDVIVVGGGPAGATAAAYLAERDQRVLLVDPLGVGGQLINVDRLRDCPGVPDGTAGWDLAATLFESVLGAEAELHLATVEVVEPDSSDRGWLVRCDDTTVHSASAVVVATGGRPAPLPGDEAGALAGRGVSYCATCDGGLFAGQTVAVVGDGDVALAEAASLSPVVAAVVVLAPGAGVRAGRARHQEVAALANVTVRTAAPADHVATDASGRVRAVVLAGGEEVAVDAVFGALDTQRVGTVVPASLPRAGDGGLLAGDGGCEVADGLFVAGEARAHAPRYVAAAIGDGLAAGHAVAAWLASIASPLDRNQHGGPNR